MSRCACGRPTGDNHRQCHRCRSPHSCACGAPKDAAAKTCWACYVENRRMTADQAAAALEAYWQQLA